MKRYHMYYQLCMSVTEVPVLLHATMEKVAEEFLAKALPVIALNEECPQKKTTLEDLYQV